VPDSQLAIALRLLLEEAIDAFRPDVIIEDTHFLPMLRAIRSTRSCKKVLLVRRLEPFALEQMRRDHQFDWYDQVLYMESLPPQASKQYGLEQYGGPMRALLECSPRFSVVEPIVAVATEKEIQDKHHKYRRSGCPLIVVNCGAGGEHGVGSHSASLFQCASDAARILEQRSVACRWVIVLGPYHRGSVPQPSRSVQVVDFEENMPALLQAADFAILRPGFNATHEALAGRAHVILVPGESYNEGQLQWTERLTKHPGVEVLTDPTAAQLADWIERRQSPTNSRNLSFGTSNAVAQILGTIDSTWKLPRQACHLVLLPAKAASRICPITHDQLAPEWISCVRADCFSTQQSSKIYWCDDVRQLTVDFDGLTSPSVLLVGGPRASASVQMADAYGAYGRGIMTQQVIEASLDDLPNLQKILASEATGGASVVAVKSDLSISEFLTKYRAIIESLAADLISKGIALIGAPELLGRLAEENYLEST
jgi:hypothetical protein